MANRVLEESDVPAIERQLERGKALADCVMVLSFALSRGHTQHDALCIRTKKACVECATATAETLAREFLAHGRFTALA